MKITRFEDIKGWEKARSLTAYVYSLTKKAAFSKDFELKNQIRAAAGSSMHNVAEGFDADTNPEFVRFLRYAKRSCSEVQSQLYLAKDEAYIENNEFEHAYDLASETRAILHGFITYLQKNQQPTLNS